MAEAVIVDAVRTPIARGKPIVGDLNGFHAAELLALSIREIVTRSGIDFKDIEYLAGGCVTQAGEQSSNVTRTAWLSMNEGYHPGANQRTDQYGGSVENRIRFVVETLAAMCSVAGADKVGIRICPGNPFNDLSDANPEETFRVLLKAIDSMGLAYLHVIRMPKKVTGVDNLALAKANFSGPLIFNDSYTLEKASQVLDSGDANAISFGRYYIANPDLVEKFKAGTGLNDFDLKTLYTPGAKGYSDY